MNKTFSLVFTGISGSGKTTLAKRVSKKLNQLGTTVQLIDGDDFRKEIGNLFGYTRDERMKNNCVARTVMKYLNKNNINVSINYKIKNLCATTSINLPKNASPDLSMWTKTGKNWFLSLGLNPKRNF